MSLRMVIAALAAACLLGACGVPLQDSPEPIEGWARATASAPPTADEGATEAQIYLVRGDRVAPVTRRLRTTLDSAQLVRALTAGPEPSEASTGIRTAIPAGTPEVRLVRDGDVVRMVLPGELTHLEGKEQILAIAQLVFTLTEIPGVRGVRLSDGTSDLPTPAGSGRLLDRPATRADYLELAPAASPTSGP